MSTRHLDFPFDEALGYKLMKPEQYCSNCKAQDRKCYYHPEDSKDLSCVTCHVKRQKGCDQKRGRPKHKAGARKSGDKSSSPFIKPEPGSGKKAARAAASGSASSSIKKRKPAKVESEVEDKDEESAKATDDGQSEEEDEEEEDQLAVEDDDEESEEEVQPVQKKRKTDVKAVEKRGPPKGSKKLSVSSDDDSDEPELVTLAATKKNIQRPSRSSTQAGSFDKVVRIDLDKVDKVYKAGKFAGLDISSSKRKAKADVDFEAGGSPAPTFVRKSTGGGRYGGGPIPISQIEDDAESFTGPEDLGGLSFHRETPEPVSSFEKYVASLPELPTLPAGQYLSETDPRVVALQSRGAFIIDCSTALDVGFMLAYTSQDFRSEEIYATALEALAKRIRMRVVDAEVATHFKETVLKSFDRRKPFAQYAAEKARETIVKAFAATLELEERRTLQQAMEDAEAKRAAADAANTAELDNVMDTEPVAVEEKVAGPVEGAGSEGTVVPQAA
ncbi:hypothetical protein RQP46_002850 [Phenoliferia psychrophenolica]